ncbi:MAG: metallophosphoesterase [Candidatus Aminicenantia bacterium]
MGKTKFKALSRVFDRLEPISLNPEKEKYVIFSDQHIGMEEFDKNKELYLKTLDYYYHEGFKLIVVGDYEELHRFGIKELKDKYKNDVYAKEGEFLQEGRYFRIFGNHDIDWKNPKRVEKYLHDILPNLRIVEGIKFKWNGNFIFLTHGHQGDFVNDKLGKLGRVILRWIARPLGFPSFTSPAKNYRRRRKDETEYYKWAKNKKVLFIAGHTHRPMFESLTKMDRIRIDVENLVRQYIETENPSEKEKLQAEIIAKKKEFYETREKEGEEEKWLRLGQADLLIPCYFNDGSCLHKNGITCVELCEGKIRLVFLYDKRKKANINKHQRAPTFELITGDTTVANPPPGRAGYMRQILEEEKLEYIFARIRLLS